MTHSEWLYHHPLMDLRHAYRQHCLQYQLEEDADQIQIVAELQSFADDMQSRRRSRDGRRSLYLWGAVGRGKTMLMDLFFDNLEVAGKRRIHFHQLMRLVRDRLAQLSGRANPMATVAAELVPAGSVICIDELHVSDVDNALVVELLFKELVSSRTVVVTTSNFSPDDVIDDEVGKEFGRNNPESPLEAGALFRVSKRETMQLLEEAFHTTRLGGSTDYRTTVSNLTSGYLDSELADTRSEFEQMFRALSSSAEIFSDLTVFDRPVGYVRRTSDVYWLSYPEICETPHSYRDYLELLAGVRAVLLEDVQILTLDGAKRFGWLMEVIYDAGITLRMTGNGGLPGLYRDIKVPDHLALEQARILSRVRELTR